MEFEYIYVAIVVLFVKSGTINGKRFKNEILQAIGFRESIGRPFGKFRKKRYFPQSKLGKIQHTRIVKFTITNNKRCQKRHSKFQKAFRALKICSALNTQFVFFAKKHGDDVIFLKSDREMTICVHAIVQTAKQTRKKNYSDEAFLNTNQGFCLLLD